MKRTYVYGWKKDKFRPLDPIHMMMVRHLIPDKVILTPCSVRDQGQTSSCTGFGIGGLITSTKIKLGLDPEWFSPEWIYNGERYIEGTLSSDSGANPGDGFDWLVQNGGLLEQYWPYDGFEATSPPSSLKQYASEWPVRQYRRVTGDIDGICSAIASGCFVAIGSPWFKTWEDVDPSGQLPEVSKHTPIAGGHETFLFGYDRTQNVFFGQNSWGETFGNGGRYVMPFSAFKVFKKTGGYDSHIVDVNWK